VSQIIAVFNQAGGVGKTTLTMNIGYHLSMLNQKVLLVDLDPQASLTTFMGVVPETVAKTPYDALINEESLFVLSNVHQMDLAPSNINLSVAEIQLVNLEFREVRLLEAINSLSSNYDFILIDCPPSLGLLSYVSLVAATHILVPIQCQFKAFAGTNILLKTVARVKRRPNRELQIAGFIPTLFDSRRSQDERTLTAIKERFSKVGTIYPPIPWSTSFADAAEARVPLAIYDKNHKALTVLRNIVKGLENL